MTSAVISDRPTEAQAVFSPAVGRVSVRWVREKINQEVEWTIQRDRHTLIVHLGGEVDQLESELAGAGCIRGRALPGEIWFIPAGSRYSTHAQGRAAEYVTFQLDSEVVGKVVDTPFTLVGALGRFDPFLHHAASRLSEDLQAIQSYKPEPNVLICDQWVYGIATHLSQCFGAGKTDQRKEKPIAAFGRREQLQLRDYFHSRLNQPIHLKDLEKLTGLNTDQLLARFRASFGTTPAQYLIETRLRRARQLLLESPFGIADIAYACGFSSHSHLTAQFRQRYGWTPSQFKTRLQC